jgi:hypothetical protein
MFNTGTTWVNGGTLVLNGGFMMDSGGGNIFATSNLNANTALVVNAGTLTWGR